MRLSSLQRKLCALPMGLALMASAGGASAADHRYALSVLHFNIQYVAGGLRGFLPTDDPTIDLDAEQVEDAIVRESFEPVLDMLLAHPTWGADIELQGYMLDVMADRHPGVLDKLRTLATSEQVEVISFHYSDQLFMAYPREDWARSQKLTKATFDRYDIPLGKAVFCQEGQAGPGMAAAMAQTGYQTLIFPKNLYAYQHGDFQPAPLYRFGDVEMVTSQGFSGSFGAEDIDVQWWFVDDGELLATGKVDPYIAENFKKNPAAIADREQQLQALEDAGYAITTVSKYASEARMLVTKVDLPELLDGTWQPNSTEGIHRWMGGHGLWWKDERDNDVRSLGAMAHRELLAAETIAAKAALPVEEEIAAGFRLLALGEVSDGTGINPFRGEVEYAIGHFTEALRIARDVIVRGKEALAASAVSIDTQSGEVSTSPAAPPAPEAVAEVLPITVSSGDRSSEVRWEKLSPGRSRVTLHFGVGDEQLIQVKFPGTDGDIVYTPGLSEGLAHVPRGAFVFDHFELALSNGLIGLGQSGFLVKDQASVHIGARIVPGAGDVVFEDDTAPPGEAITWVFYLVQGSEEEALSFADALNVRPEVRR